VADYSITVARSARRELESLDSSVISRILPKIESLASPRVRTVGANWLARNTCGTFASAIIESFTQFSTKNDASTLSPCAIDAKPAAKQQTRHHSHPFSSDLFASHSMVLSSIDARRRRIDGDRPRARLVHRTEHSIFSHFPSSKMPLGSCVSCEYAIRCQLGNVNLSPDLAPLDNSPPLR